MKRLEEIVSRIESNELDIDQLGEYLQEAQKLIKFCKNKLYKADAEIKKILEEDNEAQAWNKKARPESLAFSVYRMMVISLSKWEAPANLSMMNKV